MNNAWCDAIGCPLPSLESIRSHPEASYYAMLIVALLERGEPMTLEEVATRFEEVDVAPAERALGSLERSRPNRAPVYRDGDRYALDPHDESLEVWLFRLGLRPPKVAPRATPRQPKAPPPSDVPLSIEELDEAWKDASLFQWSDRRLALAVLDAHGKALEPQEVIEFLSARTSLHSLRADNPVFRRRGSPIDVLPDGRWAIVAGSDAVVAARDDVRDRLVVARRHAALRPDPVEQAARRRERELQRAVHAAELESHRRLLLYAHPRKKPEAVALLDATDHTLETFVGDQLAELPGRLAGGDVIAAIDVRALLGALGFDPESRRLAELGPPQKTRRLNKRGRTLQITTELLIRASCGISNPFGDEKKLATYLRDGQFTKLRRRLEASVKSLHAMYEYGRLHRALRLRWGFLDERIPVPWVHSDERCLRQLMLDAKLRNEPLEVVLGSAPGWQDPWSRVRRAWVREGEYSWSLDLIDDGDRLPIDEREIQRARIAATRS